MDLTRRSFHPLVRVRWMFARRPWIRWTVISLCGTAAGLGVQSKMAALDAATASWDGGDPAFVLRHDVAAGESISAADAQRRFLPPDLLPDGALGSLDAPVLARHALAAGEILSTGHVGIGDGPAGLLEPDQVGVAVPVQVGTGLPVVVGDRVGLVEVSDPLGDTAPPAFDSPITPATVLAVGEQSVLVGVPRGAAVRAATAAASGRMSLVLLGSPVPPQVPSGG